MKNHAHSAGYVLVKHNNYTIRFFFSIQIRKKKNYDVSNKNKNKNKGWAIQKEDPNNR
jgi:hypothetical protein